MVSLVPEEACAGEDEAGGRGGGSAAGPPGRGRHGQSQERHHN